MYAKTHVSAYSDAKTQVAAVNEWKQRNAQHKQTASLLKRKVKQLKSDSETVLKTTQWLQERDRLHHEQVACEESLDILRVELGGLVQDADHNNREVEIAALKLHLLQQLREVGSLAHRVPLRRSGGGRDEAPVERERVRRLREWVVSEMKETQSLADSLCSSTSHSALSLITADLNTAASEARKTFEYLCHAHEPPAELQRIFASALSNTEDEVREELARLQDSGAVIASAEDDVLRTVCLIIKMGHQARQFNLSAATRVALAERVAAVYPHMKPPQVQQAIDDGLSVRRAQAAAKAAVADYERKIAAVLSSCESAFVLAKAAEAARLERAAAARLRSVEQASRHAWLAERRASHEALQRYRRNLEAEQQSAAAAKADALRAQRAAEFQQRLQLLHAFEVQRALLREKERALQETKARAAAEEKAARVQRNEVRVDYRRRQDEQRRREQKAQEEEVRALQQKRQQTLERFFASVDKQLGVRADPQRVLKPTSSSAQTDVYVTLAETTRPSITGFSDEQIMKDPRVRLYHALLAAGLHTTPYGREVATRGYHVPPSQMSSENNPLRGQFS